MAEGKTMIDFPDYINGFFELFAGLAGWLNVYTIYKDKQIKGVSILSAIFYNFWGIWGLWYYPHLNQWASFFGTLILFFANIAWITLAVYYRKNNDLD